MARGLVLCLVLLAACALREVAGPPGREQVVVQGVLNAQTGQQVLWVERTVPAGEPLGSGLRPLATPATRVDVRDSTGAVFPFLPDPSNAARYLSSFTPTPGWRYDFVLEAGPHVLTATTRVPPAVTLLSPAGDTVSIARNATLPLTWSGPIRRIRVALADTTGQVSLDFPQWVTGDTTTRVLQFPGVPAVHVWVLAVDSVTAQVGDPFTIGIASFRQFRGNISGGVGFLGAATGDRVVVRLQ